MKEIKAKLKYKKILNNIVRDSPNATNDDEATSAELTQEGLLRLEKEAKIEKKLKNIEQAWTKIQFEFEEYNGTKCFVPLDTMMELLD